jgi:hypothetical protein
MAKLPGDRRFDGDWLVTGRRESMVIGWLQREQEGLRCVLGLGAGGSGAARVRLPCLLVPQPAHAVLAGELAAGLDRCFGELPPEINAGHSDARYRLGLERCAADSTPALWRPAGRQGCSSFLCRYRARGSAEAWTASIDSVEALSKIGAIIVSRHFSLLAQHDPAQHQRFLRRRRSRQQKLEGSTMATREDLDRWTAALGFCDLVSLYLVSGLSREVEFPLAHPASPQAQTAPRVTMQMEGRTLRFTPADRLAPAARYPSRRSSIRCRRKARVPRHSPGRCSE